MVVPLFGLDIKSMMGLPVLPAFALAPYMETDYIIIDDYFIKHASVRSGSSSGGGSGGSSGSDRNAGSGSFGETARYIGGVETEWERVFGSSGGSTVVCGEFYGRRGQVLTKFGGLAPSGARFSEVVRHLREVVPDVNVSKERFTDRRTVIGACRTYFDFDLHGNRDFDRLLDKYVYNFLSILYAVEVPYAIIYMPMMGYPYITASTSSYRRKFLEKVAERIGLFLKLSDRFDLKVLLSYNPLLPAHSIYGRKGVYLPSSFAPFRDFSGFVRFYGGLAEEYENIGLYIEPAAYFSVEFRRITEYLFDSTEIVYRGDKFGSDPAYLDRYILRNRKIAEEVYRPLRKVGRIGGVALEDSEIFGGYVRLSGLRKEKGEGGADTPPGPEYPLRPTLPYMGNMPLDSFYYYLVAFNSRFGRPEFAAVSPPLLCGDRCGPDRIDWRGVRPDKLAVPEEMRAFLIGYIKSGGKVPLSAEGSDTRNRRRNGSRNDNRFLRGYDDVYIEDIREMRIFSPYFITRTASSSLSLMGGRRIRRIVP